MSDTIRIVVPGTPQGKGRPRAFSIKKGALAGQVRMYTPQKTRSYEGIIRSLGMDAMKGRPPLTQPLKLHLVAYAPVPESWANWKRAAAAAGSIYPTTKPDLDNVEKAICDGLNEVVWVDDCRICSVTKSKVYGSPPRIEVTVEVLAGQSAQDAERDTTPAPEVMELFPVPEPAAVEDVDPF